jgi:hypothetical protein
MWNFIKGINPPIKKRKTEDKTLYYSEYESSKRVRVILQNWKKIDRGLNSPTMVWHA